MNQTVIIYIDSQEALEALQAVKIRSKLTLGPTHALKELPECNSVLLKWKPGYQAISESVYKVHGLARKDTDLMYRIYLFRPENILTRTTLKQKLLEKYTEY